MHIERISGKFIDLRPVVKNDASFILELRLDPYLRRFIHDTEPYMEKQIEWLVKHAQEHNDYYFILENKSGKNSGTIAVYGIDAQKKKGEWGRWLIRPGQPVWVAIESMLMIYHFSFFFLNLETLINGTQNENKHVIFFHKQYANILRETEKETWFYVNKEDFPSILQKFPGMSNFY